MAAHSDAARSFVQALAERGYVLATGKRPYLVVDFYGNADALPKLIDDKSVRTADIRAFLERDYPAASLPSVEEAKKLVAAHRKLIERSLREDQYADGLAALKHSQQERRVAIEAERVLLTLWPRGSSNSAPRSSTSSRRGAMTCAPTT